MITCKILGLVLLSIVFTRNVYCLNDSQIAEDDPNRPIISLAVKGTGGQTEVNCILKSKQFTAYTLSDRDSLLCYHILAEYRYLLTHPNRLHKVTFNGQHLIFDKSTILPRNSNYSFGLYSCRHNNTKLISIHTLTEYAFYLPDPNTGKWTNCKLASLNNYENQDENGLVVYKLRDDDKFDDFYDLLLEEWRKLVENTCKDDQCPVRVQQENPPLELFVILNQCEIEIQTYTITPRP